MPHFRAPRRAAPLVPIQPRLPQPRRTVRQPRPVVHPPRPVPPTHFPVLQPPTYSIQSDFIYQTIPPEQQELQEDIDDHRTIFDNTTKNRKITQQITVRIPTFLPQQNYPRQPILRLTTRPSRHAEPKYATYLYSSR